MRTACIALVPLIVVSWAFSQAPAKQLGAIAAALQNRDFATALELLRPALRQFPADAQLRAMQGTAYAGRGDKQQALASFLAALKISPDYLVALRGAAQIEYDAGSGDGIPLLQHILRLRPTDSTAHGMLAVLEYQHENCSAAVVQFQKAGELFASQPAALHAYAACLVRLKQFDRAGEVFERTVALNPQDRRERQLLATIELMASKPREALATLEPLMQASNPDAETLELASRAHENNQETTQAVNLLRQAILLEPQNVDLYLDFANLSYAHASYQVGIDVVSDGLVLQPRAAPLYFARGVLYVQLAQYEKAEADFQTAYQLDPNQSLSSAAQGIAAAQTNDFDRALAEVQASLARKPDDAFMLYLQADLLARRNADPASADFELAMRSARKAVGLQPTLGPARAVLAKLYLESGKYQQAAAECRKALETNPKDQVVLYHLIQALRKSGNTAEIPDLLKRFALLRKQAVHELGERFQYKLVEGDVTP